ncbi:uncharacterized protein B0P05DRAFT_548628 [Gilbertella persicaria]|uniref:uncharacterized protein n=1 Tax=Gilbertella persicaria TaxID=101096 RepID=UPI00222103E5|nr:uncharacterized protein B0P05DRAFT_548628 [Gilbertella persicaria]KAI8073465.1 hypothetical protein B0P05DRAFT_548628 [Gilbertella persicaria]
MKTGAESRSRETKLNTKPFQSRFNSIQTRTSPRKYKTKKSEEVIEIDSEDEQKQDTFFDAEQEIESNSAKKRRLIRRDSEDKETCLPELKMNRRKTTSSPVNPNYFKATKQLEEEEEEEEKEEEQKEEEGVLKKTFQRATQLFKTIIPSVQDPDYKPTKTTDEQPSVSTTVKLPYDPIDDYELIVTGADEHLLTYPFRGKKSVTVYERDLDRLKDETYLNDTLLDVFPKIWSDEYPEANIYTFSSFFYTKLAGQTMDYDTVKRWTSHVDIFKKKFLIIPIAQHNHWFVLVVVNPGYCIRGPKGTDYHSEEEEQENLSESKTKKRSILPGTPLDRNRPYILTLDPLNLNKHSVAKVISQYLKKEALTKLNIDASDFLDPEIVMASCPGQKNFTDCGVFCLHYMKNLYQFPEAMMDTLYQNTDNGDAWDRDHSLPGFRCHLKRMLKRKIKEYREYLLSHLDDQS